MVLIKSALLQLYVLNDTQIIAYHIEQVKKIIILLTLNKSQKLVINLLKISNHFDDFEQVKQNSSDAKSLEQVKKP